MIRMINGYTGVGSRRVGPQDGPFELAPEAEERLVGLGVAAYVNDAEATDCGEGSSAPAQENPAQTEKTPSATPEYSETNTVKELLAICEQYGIDVGAKPSKKAILAALDLYFSEEAPPDLSAAMPE